MNTSLRLEPSGYDVEPGLVNASGENLDWDKLYPKAACHPEAPTSEDYARAEAGCSVTEAFLNSWETCDECGDRWMTARMALVLHTYAMLRADELRDGLPALTLENIDAPLDPDSCWFWEGELLPYAVTDYVTVGWAHRFAATFETLAGRIASGNGLWANCTGEEMAIHLLVEHTEALYFDGMFHAAFYDWLEQVEPAGERDEQFGRAVEWAVEDHDVLEWFSVDPLQDPTTPDTHLGMMLNLQFLRPHDWFLPFRTYDDASSL